jgi:hypothetical protein
MALHSSRFSTVRKLQVCCVFIRKLSKEWREMAKLQVSKLEDFGGFGLLNSTNGWNASPAKAFEVTSRNPFEFASELSYPDAGCQCRLDKGGIFV